MPANVSLYVQKFEFHREVGPDGKIVEIEGRNKGLIGTILNALGIAEKSYLIITKTDVTFRFTNLGGTQHIVCPLDSITCSISGVTKPLSQLIWGLVAAIVGFFILVSGESALTGLLIGAVGVGLVVSYLITQNLTFLFSTGDIDGAAGLAFDASTAGGQRLTIESLLEIVEHVNYHIVDLQARQK
ncbi:MAG: hypothetical protein JXA10_18480 [Anaerolineae bacterium]|nr:hypothetical protein [Anaerolineae bacterium]